MKTVYQTDSDGVFIGPVEADESPLERGVFLIPAGAFEMPPPSYPSGSRARRFEGAWVVEKIPEPTSEATPYSPEETNPEIPHDSLESILAEMEALKARLLTLSTP